MYKKTKRDKVFRTINGALMPSIVTLEDEYGGRAQISIDDSCYVLYLKQPNGFYKSTQWIFDEVHSEITKLPLPSKARLKLILEMEVERIERERYVETI